MPPLLHKDSLLHFPVVVKQSNHCGGTGVSIAHDINQLQKEMQSDFLIEKFIPGEKQIFCGVCFEGEVLEFFCAKVVSSKGETGQAILLSIVDNCCIPPIAQKVIKLWEYTGFIDFDFILGEDGLCYLLDSNPRPTHVSVSELIGRSFGEALFKRMSLGHHQRSDSSLQTFHLVANAYFLVYPQKTLEKVYLDLPYEDKQLLHAMLGFIARLTQ